MNDHLDNGRVHAGLRAAVEQVESALQARSPDILAPSLEELGRALHAHIDQTEAPGGLLDEIAHEAPQLASRVQRARDDHLALQALYGDVRTAFDDHAGIDLRDRTTALLEALVRHRDLGTEMAYDAYNVDLEAAD